MAGSRPVPIGEWRSRTSLRIRYTSSGSAQNRPSGRRGEASPVIQARACHRRHELPRLSSLKNCLGSRMSQRAFGPSPGLGHFHRVDLVAEDAHQFGSSRQARCRHHSFPAVQTTRYPIHRDLPRNLRLNGSQDRWFQTGVAFRRPEESHEVHPANARIRSYPQSLRLASRRPWSVNGIRLRYVLSATSPPAQTGCIVAGWQQPH